MFKDCISSETAENIEWIKSIKDFQKEKLSDLADVCTLHFKLLESWQIFWESVTVCFFHIHNYIFTNSFTEGRMLDNTDTLLVIANFYIFFCVHVFFPMINLYVCFGPCKWDYTGDMFPVHPFCSGTPYPVQS